MQLHTRVLASLTTADDGRTVFATMMLADLTESGANLEMSEGIVDALAHVAEADVAIFFKEDGPAAARISVRTKGDGPDATAITGRPTSSEGFNTSWRWCSFLYMAMANIR